MAEPLYVFIDESGNFDFTEKGTKHFVLTALTTRKPLEDRATLLDFRYKLLAQGQDQEYFHATEDRQTVRDGVFSIFGRFADSEIDAIVIRKAHLDSLMRYDDRLYEFALRSLLTHLFHRHRTADDVSEIVVVVGALFTGKKRGFILKKLKTMLKHHASRPFHVYFHSVRADINCQIADYCGWAIYVHFERNEHRPFEAMRHLVADMLEVL